MKELLRRHHISFKVAFSGLFWAWRTQPNFRVHSVFAVSALGLAWFLKISRLETLIVIFTIILGLTAEMINTALESMTDLITTEYREQAKIAKDVSAGMMLTVAIGAVIVAAVIFLPYIARYFI